MAKLETKQGIVCSSYADFLDVWDSFRCRLGTRTLEINTYQDYNRNLVICVNRFHDFDLIRFKTHPDYSLEEEILGEQVMRKVAHHHLSHQETSIFVQNSLAYRQLGFFQKMCIDPIYDMLVSQAPTTFK